MDLQPTDSHVLHPGEQRRLSAQNAAVLARLQRGPATRKELQDIAPNVTARISDLRTAGYRIPKPVEDKTTGWSVYRLVPEGSLF
jgi:hypothetical protein